MHTHFHHSRRSFSNESRTPVPLRVPSTANNQNVLVDGYRWHRSSKILSPTDAHTHTHTRKSSIIGVGSLHFSISFFSFTLLRSLFCFVLSPLPSIRNADGIADTLPYIPVGWCSSVVLLLYTTHARTTWPWKYFYIPCTPSPFPIYSFLFFFLFLGGIFISKNKIAFRDALFFFSPSSYPSLSLFYLYIRFYTDVFQLFFFFSIFFFVIPPWSREDDTAVD